mmetsp:Transcript_16788/g.21395  ORF Transcript_16788/g.21395 Transcript_16788/m.21395 type:complete len:88 (-) Transcript_16788:1773-2036(-)
MLRSFNVSLRASHSLMCLRMCQSKPVGGVVDEDVFDYVACPISKQKLERISDTELKSDLGIVFQIKHGIPILNPLKGRVIKDKDPVE